MHDFTILTLPGAYASSVASTLDILQAAAALAPQLQLPSPQWRVVSPDGGLHALHGGMSIKTRRMPARPIKDRSVWIVPGLGVDSPAAVVRRLSRPALRRAAIALQQHSAGGGAVAASCSAVFLLHAAGLLQGHRATTAWWLAAELRRLSPQCTVQAERMVVKDRLVTTAGAAFGQTHLMLALLEARFGLALPDMIRKVLLIDGRQAQAPFIISAMLSNGNALIERLTQRIEAALPNPPGIATLAAEFAMSPRTLARHVFAATGQKPLALVQSIRLNRARFLLENSRMGMDQIAAQLGYADATSLRRLIRKATGVNPGQFRGNPMH